MPWSWNKECQNMFEELKVAFTLVPTLTYWNPNAPLLVETDISNYAIAAIVRVTGHRTPGESSVILQIVVMIQLTSRRILRD